MKKIFIVWMIPLFLGSCHSNLNNKSSIVLADSVFSDELIPVNKSEKVNQPTKPVIRNSEVIEKKIIKDGQMEIEVQELEKTKRNVDSLITKYGGYYEKEKLINSNWEISYKLKIRVPCIYFENLIQEIEKGDGEIQDKEINTRDITDEFVDLEIRLNNKKNYLQRYNELLKQAKTVNDILEIEEKIRAIQEEIESTTGKLKYLSDQVDYSTLNLEISKPLNYKHQRDNRDNFLDRIKYSFSKGWIGFVDFLVFIVKIWPLWIIISITIYIWRKLRRKRKVNS